MKFVLLKSTERPAAASAERALASLALLPDEAGGKIDVDDVIFAIDRILQGVATPLAHALDAERAFTPGAFDGDLRLHETGDLESGPKQLPREPAELAGEDLGERLDLPVSGRGLDDEGGLAVALVDSLGPHEDPGALHAGEVGIATATIRHREADERAAAAVFGVWEAAKVTAATEVAIAELVSLSAHLPTGFRRGRHSPSL
jgi:hypothetical protein